MYDTYVQKRADVIVVGAGLAGLSAAHRLQMADVDVMVLEAAGQVGGRTCSAEVGGHVADVGAEWLGPRHVNLNALIRSLGLRTEPARMLGRSILWRGGCGTRLSRSLPPRQELAAGKVLLRARRLARRLDPRRPWTSPGAAGLDATSFGTWLTDNGVGGDLYRYFSALVGMLTGTPIERLSLLQVLWWIARAGGPLAAIRTTFASRVTGGTQTIARSLADALSGRVQVSSAVGRVTYDPAAVHVQTSAGNVHHARRLIVTGSLDAKIPIEFDPPLPPALRALGALRIPPGLKVSATLPDGHRPPQTLALGGDPIGGAWRNGTRVTGFALPGRDGTPDADLIADLAACFSVPPAGLRDTVVFRWSEHPSVGGCDIGFAPGQLTSLAPNLHAGHGPIRFAGAERSSWPNNMEGAVESGYHAADETIRTL